MYQLFVGEIGYNRHEFLHDLKFWEIRCIIKGYRNRAHTQWESMRLSAFFIMSSMTDLRKAGIYRDTDLIKFPWERMQVDVGNQPTKEDVERLREMMRHENEQAEKQQATVPDGSTSGSTKEKSD